MASVGEVCLISHDKGWLCVMKYKSVDTTQPVSMTEFKGRGPSPESAIGACREAVEFFCTQAQVTGLMESA